MKCSDTCCNAASKQMVYGVYGNVISIIEEHEKRESPNKRLAISDIQIPDQSRKGNDDVCLFP
ncbi:hypothetical protein DPMN_161548 [Dreissena polymorpha]|uniref:Uncharacterized protein n=1 Tax=Dreissena polymorpha TaxID=45954 RepID=A0A9D4IPR9_DREPO|nr:hypothetical protein DPMN_161548 [Dreissena polymorpha]